MQNHTKLLKIRLLAAFILFSLVPMLCIALYSYQNIKKQMIAAQLSHLEAIAKMKSLEIEQFYTAIHNHIRILQNSPYTRHLVSLRHNLSSPDFQEAKILIQEQLGQYAALNDIDEVFMMDLEGGVLAESLRTREHNTTSYDRAAFEAGKRQTYVSPLYYGHAQNKNFLITLSAPITDSQGVLAGVVVAEFVVDSFFKQIQDYSGLGTTGETLLGRKSDQSVQFLNPLRHDPNAGMQRRAPVDGALARPVIMAASGVTDSGESVDYRGVNVLAAWRYIPDFQWGMVAKIDADEALAPLRSIRNSIVLTGIVLLFFGVVFSFSTAANLTRPVEHLESAAYIDTLTGLPNRKMLMGNLERALIKARITESQVAVMFMDLDGFKGVNDTYGHEVGDQLLKIVAQRLNRCVRQSDTVARLGGDEFIILLCGIKSVENVSKIAKVILQTLSEPIVLTSVVVHTGASIGISIFPQNANTTEEMIKKADGAMYEVKKSGKNGFGFA